MLPDPFILHKVLLESPVFIRQVSDAHSENSSTSKFLFLLKKCFLKEIGFKANKNAEFSQTY